MKLVGQFLKAARIKRKMSLQQVAAATRIRIEYLTKIESGKFTGLPTVTFVKGFIQNYARTVGVDPRRALAVFRRDYDQNERGQIIPRGLTHPIKDPSSFYHPETTTAILTLVLLCIFAVYLLRQLTIFTSGPAIAIATPQENSTTGANVVVSGSTATDAMITINSQPVATKSDGSFQTTLNLAPGRHTIVIKAESRENKTRTITRTVTVTP